MAEPGIPLSVELTTGWKALALIRHQLGIAQTTSVISSMIGAMRNGEPFGHLPRPADRRETLSRKQIAPVILLYRALCERMQRQEALDLARKVAIEGARVFLRRMVGILDRDRLENLSQQQREELAREVGHKFFNAELTFEEISPHQVRFTATACRFPSLCRKAGTPELAPLLCEGDETFFGQDLQDVELIRPHTITGGADTCSFTLRFKDA